MSQTDTHQARGLMTQPPPTLVTAAPWLAITGGKGGVGKTTLAVNVAILAARSGRRTLLVDLDPGLGNVDVHLRLAPRYTVEDLADGACSPAEAVVTGADRLGVLSAASGSTRLASGDARFVERVLETVARAARAYELIVCDCGAGIGPAVLATAARANAVWAVTTPEPAAVTDAYALCKLLAAAGRLPNLVVNRVANRNDAMRTATRLSSVCRKFLGQPLRTAGWIDADRALERSVIEQTPFALHGDGPTFASLRALTADALSRLPATARARRR